jgi:chromatin remodeling complex protein RSC6
MESTQEQVQLKTEVSSLDQLKGLLSSLTDQSNNFKSMINQVKLIVKDVEKQSKELEKFRNKKNRIKTQRKEDAQPSGITKPVAISDELALFLGVKPGTLVPRNEVTKGVSDYVRKNELFNPENKQKFLLDTKDEGKKLWELLGKPTDGVTYFNLQRYLKPHYLKVDEPSVSESVPEPVSNTDSGSEEPKKKKIIIKRKKEPLAEEV